MFPRGFYSIVVGEGFEPSKAVPSDLQSDPFDRSGNPPICLCHGPEYGPIDDFYTLVFLKTGSPTCIKASGGIRTRDLLITNQLLCQLSYAGAVLERCKHVNIAYRHSSATWAAWTVSMSWSIHAENSCLGLPPLWFEPLSWGSRELSRCQLISACTYITNWIIN